MGTIRFSFIIILCLVASFVDAILIDSNQAFVSLANQAANGDFNFDIELGIDLDFKNSELTPIVALFPLGMNSSENCAPYSGIFDGNGHTIKNLDIKDKKSAGLFCGVSGALIKNLTVDDSCSFTGNFVGGISPVITGNVTVHHVQINADINVKDTGSGFLGYAKKVPNLSIIIEECAFGGTIAGSADVDQFYVGGFIGILSSCNYSVLELCHCTNHGTIIHSVPLYSGIGGFIGIVSENYYSKFLVRDNTNYVTINYYNPTESDYSLDIGGLICSASLRNSSMVIENNLNQALLNIETGSSVEIGGFMHSVSSQNANFTLNSNTNECKIFFRSTEYSFLYIGGFMNSLYFRDGATLFTSNYNNFFMNISGLCSNANVGGFASHSQVYSSRTSEQIYTNVINNTNNGVMYVYLSPERESLGEYVGGFSADSILNSTSLYFENYTHTGKINVVLTGGFLNCGGFFGRFYSYKPSSFRGITNLGLVNVSQLRGSGSFVGGLIGNEYYLTFNMTDCANYGHVSNDFFSAPSLSETCGLICMRYPTNARAENCVNTGTVEGLVAYGISNAKIVFANNVVAAGAVKGVNESYSFWKVGKEESSLYGLKETCVNCSENVTLFSVNEKDGKYHVMNDTFELVSVLLNVEAEKKGYSMNWDRYLMLRKPTIIHIEKPVNQDVKIMIGMSLEDSVAQKDIFQYHFFAKGSNPTSKNEYKKATVIDRVVVLVPHYMIAVHGVINDAFYVEVEGTHTLLKSVKSLKQYFDSEQFAVGFASNNSLLKNDVTIDGDMSIIVLNKKRVSIDMDDSVSVFEVKSSDVADAVSALTGIDKANILVDLDVDQQGHLTVIVLLNDSDSCLQLVSDVNNLARDKNCESILCHSIEARFIDEDIISASDRVLIHSIVLLFWVFISSVYYF